jgi:hypothetical protein
LNAQIKKVTHMQVVIRQRKNDTHPPAAQYQSAWIPIAEIDQPLKEIVASLYALRPRKERQSSLDAAKK